MKRTFCKLLLMAAAVTYVALAAYAINYAARNWPNADIGNALLYTFSTVAQTLVAALAFALALGIVAIQALELQRKAHDEQESRDIDQILRGVLESDRAHDVHVQLVRRVYCDLAATLLTVTVAVLLLPATPFLSGSIRLGLWSAVIVATAAIWCLYRFFGLFKLVFRKLLDEYADRRVGFADRDAMRDEFAAADEKRKRQVERMKKRLRERTAPTGDPTAEADES